MKTDPNKSLAENVYNTLCKLLPRRGWDGAKEWEQALLKQAAMELESRDPAHTADEARISLFYEIVEGGLLPVGHRVQKVFHTWYYRPLEGKVWERNSIVLNPKTRIRLAETQSYD